MARGVASFLRTDAGDPALSRAGISGPSPAFHPPHAEEHNCRPSRRRYAPPQDEAVVRLEARGLSHEGRGKVALGERQVQTSSLGFFPCGLRRRPPAFSSVMNSKASLSFSRSSSTRNRAAILQLAEKDLIGQRLLDAFLDDARQGTGAERIIIALLRPASASLPASDRRSHRGRSIALSNSSTNFFDHTVDWCRATAARSR